MTLRNEVAAGHPPAKLGYLCFLAEIGSGQHRFKIFDTVFTGLVVSRTMTCGLLAGAVAISYTTCNSSGC